jgi:putative membrane protein
MKEVRFVFFVALAILIALFAVLNAEVMTLNLFFWRFDVSASIVILASVLLGGILMSLFGLPTQVRSHLRYRGTRKQLAELQAKNDALKVELEATKTSERVWMSKYEEAQKNNTRIVTNTPTDQG